MLCSSSTLARLDWLCNGNWRFITPAGVANHRRREAWGVEGWAKEGCMSVQRWLPLTALLAGLVHLPTGTPDGHASSHTCKHVHRDRTHMQTRAPCMPPSTQQPSWEDVRKRSHISSSLSCCLAVSASHVWEAENRPANQRRLNERNRFAGGLK